MGESSILRLSHAQHQHTVTQRPRRSPRTGGQRIECDRCDGFPNGLEGKHDLPKDKERSLKLDFFDYTCLQEDIHAGGHAMLPAMRAAVTVGVPKRVVSSRVRRSIYSAPFPSQDRHGVAPVPCLPIRFLRPLRTFHPYQDDDQLRSATRTWQHLGRHHGTN